MWFRSENGLTCQCRSSYLLLCSLPPPPRLISSFLLSFWTSYYESTRTAKYVLSPRSALAWTISLLINHIGSNKNIQTHTQFPNSFDLLSTTLNLGYNEQTTYPISIFFGFIIHFVFFSRCLTGYTISCAAFVLFNGLLSSLMPCDDLLRLSLSFRFSYLLSTFESLPRIHPFYYSTTMYIHLLVSSFYHSSLIFFPFLYSHVCSLSSTSPSRPTSSYPIKDLYSPSSLFPFPQFRHAYTRKTLRYQRFWHKIILNHNPNLLFVHVSYSH